MQYDTKILDDLLEKECYVIDFLPEIVPGDSKGHYFEVENYFLKGKKHIQIKDKFVNVILKMMCYYHVLAIWNDCNDWLERPEPEQIDNIISEIISNHSESLNCLFSEENALLVFDRDNLCLAVYNPNEKMQKIFAQIAFSEGLFWRLSPTN